MKRTEKANSNAGEWSVQFIKFGLVGVLNTVVSLMITYAVMAVLKYGFNIYSTWSLNLCTTAGYIAGVLNSYFWNNKYVFKNKKESSKAKRILKVFICYGATYLLSMIIMDFLVEVCHVPSFIAPIPRLIITIPLNFVANKFWAYGERRSGDA